jgi:rhamnogalacturonyl hydrolase YesR
VTEAAGEQGLMQIRKELAGFLNRLLEAMLALQCPDGRFHDILDEPESFEDGTSAMMTAATVYRGILGGYVSEACRGRAEAAYRTVREMIDGTGLVRGVCGCPDFLSEGTSAEAQAAFIMADAWRNRLNTAGRD